MNAAENLSAALVFRREGRPDAAVAAALKALEQDPSLAEAWECATFIYMKHGQWASALGLLESAAKFAPGHVTLDIYHALALEQTGSLAEAYARIEDVVRRAPEKPEALFAKAEILAAAGYCDLAMPCYAAAQKHDVTRKSAAFGLAGMRFMTGDFLGALPGLSALEDEAPDAPPLPLWNGKPDPAQHVVLYGSQGFGDVLMFLCYVKQAQATLGKVTLRIPWQMAQLVRDSFPDLPLVASRDPGDTGEILLPPDVGFVLPPDATTRCPLIRLSWMFDAFDPHAGDVPYLHVDRAKVAAWGKNLAAMPHPRIGLVWSGSPRNGVDHRRSVAFDMLRPLITQAGRHLVSLQMGPESARAAPAAIFDASVIIRDFSDSAALLASLDLLITVDTAAAHLAGALGRPVWNLMPFMPTDWRWLLGRVDTIWYPSMRLFRQPEPGDWASVIENVSVDLRTFLGGDDGVLRPAPWNGEVLTRHPGAVKLEEIEVLPANSGG